MTLFCVCVCVCLCVCVCGRARETGGNDLKLQDALIGFRMRTSEAYEKEI